VQGGGLEDGATSLGPSWRHRLMWGGLPDDPYWTGFWHVALVQWKKMAILAVGTGNRTRRHMAGRQGHIASLPGALSMRLAAQGAVGMRPCGWTGLRVRDWTAIKALCTTSPKSDHQQTQFCTYYHARDIKLRMLHAN